MFLECAGGLQNFIDAKLIEITMNKLLNLCSGQRPDINVSLSNKFWVIMDIYWGWLSTKSI